MGAQIDDDYLSQLVLDAVGAQGNPSLRKAAALAIYLAIKRCRNLRATVFETLAQELRPVLKPGTTTADPDDCPRARYRQVRECCAELARETKADKTSRNQFAQNLLQGLLPDGYPDITPRQVLNHFLQLWDRVMAKPATGSPVP